jgi:hypothetical protein
VKRGSEGTDSEDHFYSLVGTWDGKDLYNLGFGDYATKTGKVLDLVVSNNKDQIKILATVATTVVDFMSHHPDCAIVVRGTTPARTRLYRMNISRHHNEIAKLFDLQCLTRDDRLTRFESG